MYLTAPDENDLRVGDSNEMLCTYYGNHELT